MINYTPAKINRGPKPNSIPKGSSLKKEWAKNVWYVSYTVNGKQKKVKEGINRIKDPLKKELIANALLKSINDELSKGITDENRVEKYLEGLNENISINQAIDKYLSEIKKYTRPKTIQSYKSKLVHLSAAFPDKEINSFTTIDIEKYISSKVNNDKNDRAIVDGVWYEYKKITKWTPNTVRSAKGVFNAFFNWCIESKIYPHANPISGIKKKKIRSEVTPKPRNIPFSEDDSKVIFNYLDKYDKYMAFYMRFLYHTLLRPGEASQLTLNEIDLENRKIKIPLSVSKNTKRSTVEIISINEDLYQLLLSLNLEKYPKEYFLFANTANSTIVGEVPIGKNRPYKRFAKALLKLGLDNKGYNQYSVKHYSNIMRMKEGWNLMELMNANRHSSIGMTEKYLKDIVRFTNIDEKPIPSI